MKEQASSMQGLKFDDIEKNNQTQTGGKRCKHLIFSLADERYGIPLSAVKEVIGLTDITPVPNVPAFFKGLIINKIDSEL